MGLVMAAVAVVWAWGRIGREPPPRWPLRGAGASAFWLALGLVLGVGSVSQLFVILLPLGVVLVAISAAVEPRRAWLVVTGLVAVPVFFLASGAITARGPVVWVLVVSGITLAAAVARLFEARAARFTHPA